MAMEDGNISQDRFDYFIDQHMHKVLFVLLPIFALILYAFNRKRHSNYFAHFIFSLHFHSFMFLLLSFYLIITTYITPDSFDLNVWILMGIALLIVVYLFIAQKKVYKDKAGILLIKIIFGSFLYAISFFGISVLSLALYVLIKS